MRKFLRDWRPLWITLGVALAPIVVMFLFLAGRDLGGGTPVTPDRAAIVGVWTNSDGARLDFAPDGTVTVSRMPVIDDASGTFDVAPKDGVGSWKIDPWDGAGSGGGVDVAIGYSVAEVTTTGDPAHPSMFISIGDPDDGNDFTFIKQG